MTRVTAVLADDEPLVRRGLRRSLAAAGIDVVGEARNGRETVEMVLTRKPDLLFLDVQMPEMDGVTALRTIPAAERPITIFVTAYDQYAFQAFELHAADYLLKPFDEARLREALDRACARRRRGREEIEAMLDALKPRPRYLERFVVRTGGRIVLVNVDEVEWVEAADNYVRLHTAQHRHVIRETLKRLEALLDPQRFIRIHRSALVQIGSIVELRPLPSGDCEVWLRTGAKLCLSRGYRETFDLRIGHWSG